MILKRFGSVSTARWSFTMKSLILLTLLAAGVALKSPRLKFVLQGKTVYYIYFYSCISLFMYFIVIVTTSTLMWPDCCVHVAQD